MAIGIRPGPGIEDVIPQPPYDPHSAQARAAIDRAVANAAAQNPAAALRFAAMQAEFEPVSLRRSAVFGFGAATLASIAWAILARATGLQFGLFGLAAGVAAGFGARQGGRGRGPQVIGALAGAFAYFLGNFIIVTADVVSRPYTPSATMPVSGGSTATTVWLYHHSLVGFFFGMGFAEILAIFTSVGFFLFAGAVLMGWLLPKAR